jgi:hypothetical protein
MSTVGPLGDDAKDSGAPTINDKKSQRWAPLMGADGDSATPTINVKNIDGEPPRR